MKCPFFDGSTPSVIRCGTTPEGANIRIAFSSPRLRKNWQETHCCRDYTACILARERVNNGAAERARQHPERKAAERSTEGGRRSRSGGRAGRQLRDKMELDTVMEGKLWIVRFINQPRQIKSPAELCVRV